MYPIIGWSYLIGTTLHVFLIPPTKHLHLIYIIVSLILWLNIFSFLYYNVKLDFFCQNFIYFLNIYNKKYWNKVFLS